ncbi:MAG: hypothetical protein GAK28_01540 [Luteibacter sp.]|uniref:hypothetical protein n=1 Tax=Luteibacter sp. TaxID=1886636 RepID=UPI001384B6DA|nr:hypothetical protein [Luteibacter sp.]KAF1007585.1 MAG: hypothetical protein GAK28_01540 [Luteibacter sp.]
MDNFYKKPNDQKLKRGPKQKASVEAEKATEAREIRLKAHNNWPRAQESQAERDFAQLLDKLAPSIVMTPYPFLNGNTEANFHRHLGMLIDALDMLPRRPDHAFDLCFRSLDELAQELTKKGTITDALNRLGSHVCHSLSSAQSWKNSIDKLSVNMPKVSGRYLAQRLLDVLDTQNDPLKNRAVTVLGGPFCNDFFKKYRTDLPSSRSPEEAEKILATANNRAGEFLSLLMSSRAPLNIPPGQETKYAAYERLDLSNPDNVFDQAKALSVMLSLLAYNARNERVHGSSLSPFRSSKASLTTYASYYFQFHLIYAIAVGLMIESFPGCGDSIRWNANVDENMGKYHSVFGPYSRKT